MTIEEQTIIPIDVSELVSHVEKMKKEGNRLVQIGCTGVEEGYEINYSFDKDYKFQNLRILVKQDTVVPSISGVYWGAFIYENEIHDLFGITIAGMNIDFKGTLYKTTVKYPFSIPTFKEDDPCQNK
jgi:ech hydrogenase subunit D